MERLLQPNVVISARPRPVPSLIRVLLCLVALAVLPGMAAAQPAPPTISKDFSVSAAASGDTIQVSFNISNSNATTLTGIAFTDDLPAGLVVATPPNVTNDCGGTVTATAGTSTISLSGGALDPPPPPPAKPTIATANAQGNCVIFVSLLVTATGPTQLNNTTGPISATESGAGIASNTAVLDVVGTLTVQKQFGAASIPLGGTTSLTFTITDPANNPALSNGQINDTLPSGLVVANPNGATTTCSGGTVTAPAGGNAISLSGFSFPAISGGTCQFAVDVAGSGGGTQDNTADPATMTFDSGSDIPGTVGSNAAQASIDVVAPPTIAKAFNPGTIVPNGTTSLTFTITNPAANTDVENGVAFTDVLPTGLTVASQVTTACGGTLTTTAPSNIALAGGSIAVGSNCQFSVVVTGVAAGQYTNVTGAVSSTNGGTGNAASADLVVDVPPAITKAFAATTIPLNGTTTLDFTISNSNSTPLTGLAFTDALASGLVVASNPAPTNNCGGTLTATSGSSTISLSGGSLAGAGNSPAVCDVVVAVQGTTAGFKPNSVTITSNEAGQGNTWSSGLTVIPPPSIAKAFGAASIPLNGSTSLTFTITNQDPESSQSAVAFTDTLPAGLIVATPNGLTGSCGSGTIAATAGSGSISLANATLSGGGTCTFAVNVTGTTAGTKTNVTGPVSSSEGGTGGTASAALDVEGPPVIAKAFSPAAIAVNGTSTLTFTITNPAANALALSGVAFSDTLPSGLSVATASSSQCGGTLTVTAPTSIALAGASINANSQCQFSVAVTGAAAGQYTNTTGNVTSTNGGTGNIASANLTVATVPTINKAFGTTTLPLNGTTTLTFTLVNPNNSSLTGLAFTDNFPAGLAVAASPSAANGCGGTFAAAANATSVSLSGGTLAGGASCTASVNVTGTAAGTLSNTTGPIQSNESGSGMPSNTATLTVVAPPTIAKSFGAASIPEFATTSLTFTLQNSNTNALTGVAFSDPLPSGLVVASPNALINTCGGSAGASAGANAVTLTGATLAGGGSCSLSVNVTANAVGTMTNVTGAVTSTEGGTGGTATATLQVGALAPPTIAKAFGSATVAQATAVALSFTITNPNPASTLTGIGFSDTLPGAMVVANPNGLSGGCGGGAISASSGSGTVSLSGASLAAGSSCTFSVNVISDKSGNLINVTGPVTSNETGPGTGSNAAALRVQAPTPIPTPALDRWTLLLLAFLLAGCGWRGFQRHPKR